MKKIVTSLTIAMAVMLCGFAAGPTSAVEVDITGGQTSVLLDADVLASVGLTISGVSSAVIAPGNLGADSVAFPINPRDAADPLLATTFSYNTDDFLGTFSGALEHEGSVFFNMDTVEVGNFKIAFDAGRADTTTSGFYVESTVGTPAILFDVAPPSSLSATVSGLMLEADLLVSPEFANFLNAPSASGALVGDAFIQAVPEPASASLLVCCGLAAWGVMRRRARQDR